MAEIESNNGTGNVSMAPDTSCEAAEAIESLQTPLAVPILVEGISTHPEVSATDKGKEVAKATRPVDVSNDERKEDEDEEEEEEEEEDRIVEKSASGRFHKRHKRFPRQVPGIDNAFVAIEPKSGKEVIWNEIELSEKRTELESRLAAVIKKLKKNYHPFLVRFLDAWVTKFDNGMRRMVFITERLDQATLKQFMANSERSKRLWKRHIGQVLSVLKFLRQVGFMHGNLTNETIYYQNSGSLKVGTFALDVLLNPTDTYYETKSKPDNKYLAPEYSNSKCSLTPAVDIYALGVIALEIAVWDPNDNTTSSKPVGELLSLVEDRDQRNFIELCLKPSPDDRPTLRELINHPAMMEVPTLKQCAAKVMVDSTRNGTEDDNWVASFANALKDYSSHLEDDTVVVEILSSDGSTKKRCWRDFRSNFTLTNKYLEDVKNNYYPFFGCRAPGRNEEDTENSDVRNLPIFDTRSTLPRIVEGTTVAQDDGASSSINPALSVYNHGHTSTVSGAEAHPVGTLLTTVSENTSPIAVDLNQQPHHPSGVSREVSQSSSKQPNAIKVTLTTNPVDVDTGNCAPLGQLFATGTAGGVPGVQSGAVEGGNKETGHQEEHKFPISSYPEDGEPCISPIVPPNDQIPSETATANTLGVPDAAGPLSKHLEQSSMVEEEEEEEEEEKKLKENRPQEPQLVHVTAPGKPPGHPALFTHCEYSYVGCGRWQIYIQMWFVEERLKREGFIQVLDFEWHNIEYVAGLFEASRSIAPEDKDRLLRLLDCARHSWPLIDGELKPPRSQLANFDAYELHEKLTLLQQHQQASEVLAAVKESFGGRGTADVTPVSEELVHMDIKTNVESSVDHSSTIPKKSTISTSASISNVQHPIEVQSATSAINNTKDAPKSTDKTSPADESALAVLGAAPADEGVPKVDDITPKVPATSESRTALLRGVKVAQLPQLNLSTMIDIGVLAPRNHECATCDNHDYLHRRELPAYLTSPCYHCRETLAAEAKLKPETLYDAHLQHQIPWPAFLQVRYNIPQDERPLEEMVSYDCRWRSRRPCVCVSGRAPHPPCVEFPWLYQDVVGEIVEPFSEPASPGALFPEAASTEPLDLTKLTAAQTATTMNSDILSTERAGTSSSYDQLNVDQGTVTTSVDTTSHVQPPSSDITACSGVRLTLPCAHRHEKGAPMTCSHGIRFPHLASSHAQPSKKAGRT